ncbi:hypothetical protein FEM03_05930 [Phragmitibacter flavus]|uniref:MazG C-terminal domain-containing protein n=1 Tax=Phragmitibacter flavus TaxID=2576071 RepID=A0A5R8KH87_9BACT|nr:hypothetical protein [Phragmitibacter flavus]TLD71676.1 hypothetical protein FEM03_05930 [Phragmitibacter flavus]
MSALKKKQRDKDAYPDYERAKREELGALLKIKRKSKARIDEAEDGQRAGFLEEGISALIFQHAQGLRNLEGLERVDYSLLKLIPDLVRGYEVEKCALWEWEDAIIQGFKVFRKMLEVRRGLVVADLEARTISFEELNREEFPDYASDDVI